MVRNWRALASGNTSIAELMVQCKSWKGRATPTEDVTRRWCNLWQRFPIAGKHRGSHGVPKRWARRDDLVASTTAASSRYSGTTARRGQQECAAGSTTGSAPRLIYGGTFRGWRHTYARARESRLACFSSGLGLLGLVVNGWIWNITYSRVDLPGVGTASPGVGGSRSQLGVREHTILLSLDEIVVADI
jgi:hypothetical protein